MEKNKVHNIKRHQHHAITVCLFVAILVADRVHMFIYPIYSKEMINFKYIQFESNIYAYLTILCRLFSERISIHILIKPVHVSTIGKIPKRNPIVKFFFGGFFYARYAK